MNALILAAGYGKRLSPVTDYIPKALVSLGGKPVLFYLLNKLYRAGFDNIMINAHHHAGQLIKYIEKYNNDYQKTVRVSVEEKLLDTGGGIKQMLTMIDSEEDVLVHNVDIISSVDLNLAYSAHKQSGADVSLLVQNRPTGRPLLFDEQMKLCGKRSKYDNRLNIIAPPHGELEQWAFCGIQIVKPELFLNYPANKFYSIDVYTKNAARGKTISGIPIDRFYWKDLGAVQNLKEAEEDIAKGLFTPESPG